MHIPLLLLALLGPLSAMAFYPTKFRANLSMTPGISHEQMTEDVLDSVMSALFPTVVQAFEGAHGVPLSRGMLDARTAIVQSNADTDWSHPFGVWHFDGESDDESSMLLEALKAAAVKNGVEGNTFGARSNLGNALHLVQDYFAYSDAAGFEDGGGELDRMRRRNLLSQTTLSRDKPQARWHAWEESGHDMTAERSREGRRASTTEGERKQKRRVQQHSLGPPQQDSSEFDPHLWAVELAKEASEVFMLDFAEYVTDRQLQRLFGIGLDSMVLVDPLAITSPNWDDAVEKLGNMYHSTYENNFQENRGVPYTTVDLLTATQAQGPYEWFPRSYAGEASEKLNGLQDAVLRGAEFEDEVVCQGIDLDLVLCAIQQLEVGGELVLVVGREFQRDDHIEGEIFELLVDYPVVVTILQLDTGCLDNQTFTLSKNIADISNGDYIPILESQQILAFPRDGALEAPSGLGIIQMNSYVNSSSKQEPSFLVDGTMDRLLITADWTAPDANTSLKTSVRFYDQEESGFEPAVRTVDGSQHRAVWNIDAPTPGEWGFTFGGESAPDYSLTVKGRSSIQLVDVSFVQAGGIEDHEGYFRVLKTPLIAGTEIGIVGEVYGLFPNESTPVEWLLIDADTGDETELAMTPGLDPQVSPGYADQNTFFGVTKLPEGDFYVVLRGVDSLGYGFQRTSGQMFSAEYQFNQTYDVGDVNSVVDFPGEWEDDEYPLATELAIVQRDVMRQTASATAPAGQPTFPFPRPLIPTGPFFPNATGFPDTAAITLGTAGVGTGASTLDIDVTTSDANVTSTSPVLPTAPTSVIHLTSVIPFPHTVPTLVIPPFLGPGTSGFNTSVLSATVPLPVTTGVTGTASFLPLLPPLSAPTSLILSNEAEDPTLATVGTTSSPEPLSRLNATSVGSYSLSAPSKSFEDVTAAIISETRTAEACAGPAETDTAKEPLRSSPEAPNETVETAGAVPQPEESSSKIAPGCNICGAKPSSESPAVQSPSSSESSFETIVIPHQSSTETQGPVANTEAPSSPAIPAPENPEDTAAAQPDTTQGILTTKEFTSTTSTTSRTTISAAPVPTSNEGFKGCPYLSPNSAPVPTTIVSSGPAPACGPPDSFRAASANGTHDGETAKEHTGHTPPSEAPESTSPSAGTPGPSETASGEGVKSARAGMAAVVAVVFGGAVFLFL